MIKLNLSLNLISLTSHNSLSLSVYYFFLYLMAVLYIVAGVNHFLNPVMYKRIMPPSIPWHAEMVMVSGIAEIIFGLLLFFPATRIFAAWAIIVLLVAVFPANIQMMINYKQSSNPYLWIAILRLPLQVFLIWWAYQYTKHQSFIN